LLNIPKQHPFSNVQENNDFHDNLCCEDTSISSHGASVMEQQLSIGEIAKTQSESAAG